jgi:hypothetical protein
MDYLWIFMRKKSKNSYLIYSLLKKINFCKKDSYNLLNMTKKNWTTYTSWLKNRDQKLWQKIFEGPKHAKKIIWSKIKFEIFIGTKIYLTLLIFLIIRYFSLAKKLFLAVTYITEKIKNCCKICTIIRFRNNFVFCRTSLFWRVKPILQIILMSFIDILILLHWLW